MKKILHVFGLILVVCGVLLYLIGNAVQEDLEPQKVELGYVSNGKLVVTDSGYIGGNTEGQEQMGYLKGIGIFCGIGGAVLLGASFFVNEENQYGV